MDPIFVTKRKPGRHLWSFIAANPWQGGLTAGWRLGTCELFDPGALRTASPSVRDKEAWNRPLWFEGICLYTDLDGKHRLLPRAFAECWARKELDAKDLPGLLQRLEPELTENDYPARTVSGAICAALKPLPLAYWREKLQTLAEQLRLHAAPPPLPGSEPLTNERLNEIIRITQSWGSQSTVPALVRAREKFPALSDAALQEGLKIAAELQKKAFELQGQGNSFRSDLLQPLFPSVDLGLIQHALFYAQYVSDK